MNTDYFSKLIDTEGLVIMSLIKIMIQDISQKLL